MKTLPSYPLPVRGTGSGAEGAHSPAAPIDLGPSRAAAALREQLDRAAPSSRVLVVGPAGSGHRAAAFALHRRSARAGGLLIHVPPTAEALEARSDVEPGSLHLERVELLDAQGQDCLAGLLTDGLGAQGLIATSEVDLLGPQRPEAFDEELAYALNIAMVSLPPLSSRTEDLPELARAATAEFARRRGRALELAPDAIGALCASPWPGELEELELVLARAVLVARGGRIEAADLACGPGGGASPDSLPLTDRRLATVERALVVRVLEETEGNRSLAARQLGVNRSTLYNKLRAWGLH
ncbi:helix-turn-helix domain-containing protein [Engelhardtia mirabilis]